MDAPSVKPFVQPTKIEKIDSINHSGDIPMTLQQLSAFFGTTYLFVWLAA